MCQGYHKHHDKKILFKILKCVKAITSIMIKILFFKVCQGYHMHDDKKIIFWSIKVCQDCHKHGDKKNIYKSKWL